MRSNNNDITGRGNDNGNDNDNDNDNDNHGYESSNTSEILPLMSSSNGHYNSMEVMNNAINATYNSNNNYDNKHDENVQIERFPSANDDRENTPPQSSDWMNAKDLEQQQQLYMNKSQTFHNSQNQTYKDRIPKDASTQTMSLQTRIRMESSNNYHFFSLIEDYDLNTINVQTSFAPATTHTLSTILAFLFRLYWLFISINFTLVDYHMETSQNGHDTILFFSHLTDFTMMLTITYQVTSCFLTFVAVAKLFSKCRTHPSNVRSSIRDTSETCSNDDDNNDNDDGIEVVIEHKQQNHSCSCDILYQPTIQILQSSSTNINNNVNDSGITNSSIITNTRPSVIVCINWFLYTIVQPAELVIALGYWLYEYNPKNESALEYTNIYKHGIIAILLLIDGNIIGRIPLRIKHIYTSYIYENMYLLYSVYFSYSNFGSKHHHGYIYNNLNWKYDAWDAVSMAFMLMYVASPLFFMMCYFISLLSFEGRDQRTRRRGGEGGGSHDNNSDNKTREEGYCCFFNCCQCCLSCLGGYSFHGGRRMLMERNKIEIVEEHG